MSATTPTLRFPRFEDPWKPAHAGDAFRSSRARGREGLPIYSVTLDRGLVPRASLDRRFAADAADGQNLRAQPGDLVYNTMRMWQGAVGLADVECMVSPAYVVLAPKKGISSGFFNYWFQHPRMRHLLGAYSHGLTSDRLRLYPDDFAQIPLSLPKPAEQARIAQAVEAVDRKIALMREKRDALDDYKTGMVDRLFRRELRFRRDGGSEFPEWGEAKLGRIATFAKGRGVSKDDIDIAGITPCIRYGEIYTTYGEQIASVVSRTSVPAHDLLMSHHGDVIIPASGETPLDMARACCVLVEGVAIGGDINVLRTPLNGAFLAYFLTHARKREIARLAQGHTVVHLNAEHLKTIDIAVPHVDEQAKIVFALTAIDAKIDAVSTQIKGMETFRRGLIRGLFP